MNIYENLILLKGADSTEKIIYVKNEGHLVRVRFKSARNILMDETTLIGGEVPILLI